MSMAWTTASGIVPPWANTPRRASSGARTMLARTIFSRCKKLAKLAILGMPVATQTPFRPSSTSWRLSAPLIHISRRRSIHKHSHIIHNSSIWEEMLSVSFQAIFPRMTLKTWKLFKRPHLFQNLNASSVAQIKSQKMSTQAWKKIRSLVKWRTLQSMRKNWWKSWKLPIKKMRTWRCCSKKVKQDRSKKQWIIRILKAS